jgi:hypothetical protein
MNKLWIRKEVLELDLGSVGMNLTRFREQLMRGRLKVEDVHWSVNLAVLRFASMW